MFLPLLLLPLSLQAQCSGSLLCRRCSNETHCAECSQGYLYYGECIEVISSKPCLEFYSNFTCRSCYPGYGLTPSLDCQPLDIRLCHTAEGGVCTACFANRLPFNFQCGDEYFCDIDHCSVCRYSHMMHNKTCAECDPGYALNGNSLCESNSKNCSKVFSNGTCEECIYGNYLTRKGICLFSSSVRQLYSGFGRGLAGIGLAFFWLAA